MNAHQEDFEGFTVTLTLLDEDHAPDWDFESPEDEAETLRKIECGVYLWFVAKVEASIDGVVLGTDYLGGCCYESVAEFIGDPYFTDMRDAAVSEARATLARINQKVAK